MAPLPHRLACALLLGTAAALPGAAGARAQDPAGEALPEPPAQEAAQDPSGPEAPAAHDWAAALAMDARLGFNARTAPAALAALEDPLLDSTARAAALVALGDAGALSFRPTLEAWAQEGVRVERLGAILGLGELGSPLGSAEVLLVDLLRDADALVAQCALLALLRTGEPGWRELAVGVAQSPTHPLASAAGPLLVFTEEPAASSPAPAAELLLDLRFEAARRFGTVDGQAWAVVRVAALGQDPLFLDAFVMGAAADLKLPGIQDHLLGVLLEPGPSARVAAAVRAMPLAVDRLVEHGLWRPADEREWRALVDEAVASGVAALMPQSLRHACRVPSVAPTAAAVLTRGDDRFEELVLGAFGAEDEALRARAVAAVGESRNRRLLAALRRREEDPALAVRAAAWVARLRLGERQARQELREVLTGGTLGPAQRREVFDALARGSASGLVTDFLADLADELEGPDRADALALMALRGRSVDGSQLRAVYPLVEPGTTTARRVLAALGELPSREDLEFLSNRFPVEGDPDTNLVLALALARHGQEAVAPLLAGAVWSEPLHRSVLAAAVVKETRGMRLLQHWVLKPPTTATSEDIRRLGFAIGEWGGLSALQELQARMGGGGGADRPALQGALLGALAARTH